MKNEISSLELYYLIKELKVLEGSKIDRIYHQKNTPKELTISCHVTNQGKHLLKVVLPGLILIDDSKEASDTPTGFGMMLRKYLEGSRIKSIEQKDFERVVTITIDVKTDNEIVPYYLVIELFSKGNMIFCDDKFKILNILEEQTWKDRTLKRGETYLYPKSKFNILKSNEKEFTEQLQSSDKESLVKSIAILCNLGGTYAEELCQNSKIEKDRKTKTLTDPEYKLLYKNIILLLHEETCANTFEGNIFPFILESFKNKEVKKYTTFSEAIRENYDLIKHIESKKDSNKNVEKIQNVIDEQLKVLAECEEGYKENQAKGEILYEKYQEINDVLKIIKEARTKYSWNIIKQKLNDNPTFKKIIRDIDEKNNSIIIEIEK
jgi:predicted ribosome quality control (RQC) complex YloA/Tae2 family protein